MSKTVEKKKNGRPTKYTPAVEKKIADALKAGVYFEQACILGGISKVTGYAWLNRGMAGEEPYASFLNACEKADSASEWDAIERIRAGEPNWQAQAWWLERRHHKRWARVDRHEVSGPDGGKIEIEFKFDPRPPDQRPVIEAEAIES